MGAGGGWKEGGGGGEREEDSPRAVLPGPGAMSASPARLPWPSCPEAPLWREQSSTLLILKQTKNKQKKGWSESFKKLASNVFM